MTKHSRILDRIRNGALSRSDLASLTTNALMAQQKGDTDAQVVLDALSVAAPTDSYFIFMGFCPNADIANRLDKDWKQRGVCTFEFYESERQMEKFRSILVGDLIILKKRQEFGRTMRLYGHGRVIQLATSDKGDRMLRMQWSPQSCEVEVPLMACNDTVNIREFERVNQSMSPDFWEWLKV